MTKRLLIIIVVLLFAVNAWAGTAYYADLTNTTSTNVGTYDNPFRTIAAINAKAFATGDDLYFKVGTTYTSTGTSDSISIDWTGTSEDHVVVGAYYGNGLFGLNGGARPIIDGAFKSPASETGLINIPIGSNYVYVQDLHFKQSFWYAVVVKGNYCQVSNCVTYRTIGPSIVVGRASYNRITGNTVDYAGYNRRNLSIVPAYRVSVGSIVCSATDSAGASHHNIVDHNVVSNGYGEGIGFYRGAEHNIAEYNIVYNCDNVNFYFEGQFRNIIRYNISFSNDDGFEGDGSRTTWGMCSNLETFQCVNYPSLYNVTSGIGSLFYGNLVFGTEKGMYFGAENPANGCDVGGIRYVRAFGNTFIDNNTNFNFSNYQNTWAGLAVRNNLSATFTAAMLHSNAYSPANTTWAKNLFDDTTGTDYTNLIAGVADSTAVFGNPQIVSSTGWRDVAPSTVSLNFASHHLSLSSPAIDAGTYLTTINATEGSANTTMPVADTFWFGWGMMIAVDDDSDGDIDWTDTVVSVNFPAVHSDLAGTVVLENSHTYTSGGKVYLATPSGAGFSGAAPDIGSFEYYDYPNQRPVIVGPGNMTVEPTGLTIDFQATVTDADGDTVTTVWDFTTSGSYATDYTGEDPGERSIIDPETYPTTYTITITATDEHGLSNTHSFNIEVIEDSEALTCQEYYAPTLAADINAPVSRYNLAMEGFKYTPAANVQICSMYIWHRTKVGSPTNDVFVKALTLTGDNATALLGNSSVIADTNIANNSWIGPFVFDPPITVASGTTIGFAQVGDNDGNLDDAPEYDGSNYYMFGRDNGSNVDSIQTGTLAWAYAASFPYTGSGLDATDDMVVKINTLQATPETVALQDIIGVTPNGTYKEGDTIQVALQFNLPATLTDDNSNTTKNMTLTGECGDTDITLTHSSPAFAAASSLHYFTGTVPAGAVTSDLTITAITLNGDAIGGATLDIPAGHNLDNNSDIVFDTSAPAIDALEWVECTTGAPLEADTTVVTPYATICAKATSDGDSVFFADGPLSNLLLPIVAPDIDLRYKSGIGTAEILFEYTVQPGDRGSDLGVTDVDSFTHGATKLTDQGGNEITYTLPNVLSDWTYDLNLAVPKSFAYGAAWLVGSGWDADTINDLTLVPGDRLLIKD